VVVLVTFQTSRWQQSLRRESGGGQEGTMPIDTWACMTRDQHRLVDHQTRDVKPPANSSRFNKSTISFPGKWNSIKPQYVSTHLL